MSASCRDELKAKNFGFGYERPHQFAMSQWRMPNWVFLAWRVFWVLFHLAWMVRSVQIAIVYDADYDADQAAKWLIYLTNWSYMVLTLQSIIHMAVSIHSTCKGMVKNADDEGTTSWYHKLLWIFTSISFSAVIIVTIFYWTLVFKELKMAISIMTHAVTSLYVITDMFISASPTRLLHFIYPLIYGLLYTVFTAIYYILEGTNNGGERYVYPSLDWANAGPTAGLSVAVVFVALPLAHVFLFGLYTLRCYIYEHCCGGSDVDSEDAAAKTEDGNSGKKF